MGGSLYEAMGCLNRTLLISGRPLVCSFREDCKIMIQNMIKLLNEVLYLITIL